jgi:AraC-like DNA-binding protein
VSVIAARAAIAACEARGADVRSVLRAAAVSREALGRIEYRLPYENAARLWEEAAAAAHDPAFGVHVAETLPMGAYDVLDYMVAAASTAGDAIERIAHYFRLVHDRSDVRLRVEPRQARLVRRGPALGPQYEEFSLALFLVRSRAATGTDWTPDGVRFQHAPGSDARELARVFRCPIAFDAPAAELRFDRAILRLPHVRADSRLLDILTRYADGLLRGVPSRHDLVSAVSSSIARQLATAMPTLASTAAAVHVPERTLQRRLAASGASHSALVDDVRRELALRYIGDAGLSIGEIGYLLHFSEPASFSRAFRRWTGEAPAEYRARLFGRTP